MQFGLFGALMAFWAAFVIKIGSGDQIFTFWVIFGGARRAAGPGGARTNELKTLLSGFIKSFVGLHIYVIDLFAIFNDLY